MKFASALLLTYSVLVVGALVAGRLTAEPNAPCDGGWVYMDSSWACGICAMEPKRCEGTQIRQWYCPATAIPHR